MQPATAVLLGDQTLVRQGLEVVLSDLCTILGQAPVREECFNLLCLFKPDLIVIDFDVSTINAIHIIKKIQHIVPDTHIIAIISEKTSFLLKGIPFSSLKGIVSKHESCDTLREVIRKVLCRDGLAPAECEVFPNDGQRQQEGAQKLSRREWQVLEGVVQGLSSRELAYNLNISPRTVDIHRHHILKKLEVKTSVALANLATLKTT